MTDLEQRQLFDEWAANYDQDLQDARGFPFAGYKDVLDEIFRIADVEPGMKILDLGTGTGNLAGRFMDTGCEVWGADFSAAMLTRAQEKHPGLRPIQVDLRAEWPPELEQPFDRIVSAYLFHAFDLETKVKILRRLAFDCSAPSARIIVGDIGFPTAGVREQAREKWSDAWDAEEYYWAADETVLALQAAGLNASYEQISSCGGVYHFG